MTEHHLHSLAIQRVQEAQESESVSLAVPITEVRQKPGFGSFKKQAHISSFHEKFGDFKVWVNSNWNNRKSSTFAH